MRLGFAFLGALLVVAGIAALIVAHSHRPQYSQYLLGSGWGGTGWTGWSHTACDAARIGGWAALVFGAVIVAFALVREARSRVVA